MVASKVHIRNCTEGDLPKILGLYKSTLSKSPCFARDESLLRYFTHYPGVSGDSIFVAVENEGIVGLAIASITSDGDLRQGSIIELQATDTSCLDSLVQAAFNYCAGKDVDIMVAVPPVHLDKGKVFTGWLEFKRTVMMCKPLSILPLLQVLVDTEKMRKSYAGKELLFMVDSEIIRIRVSADRAEAVQVNTACSKLGILLVMSSKTLLEIAFGVVNPYTAYVTRRVRIQRLRDAPKVMKLLRILRLDMPWSVALVDSM